MKGIVELNSNRINNIQDYTNKYAYVMQDDILLGMMTPRECFHFAANLKLKESNENKKEKVINHVNFSFLFVSLRFKNLFQI